MNDKEKVIKGLECCRKEPFADADCALLGCPYAGSDCLNRLFTDALGILKGVNND